MEKLLHHKPKILVIGDLMLDNYIWGDANRISPEAPVLVLKVNSENARLGGACNVANNLIALGAKVALCGVLGDDNDGKIVLTMLESRGIECSFIEVSSAFSTIKKTRLLAANQQILRVDKEAESTHLDSALALSKIAPKIAEFDAIILSDYAKGALGEDFTREMIALANAHNKPILCDPKGVNYAKYAHATLITPNRKEAQSATNITIDSADSLKKAGFALKKMCDLRYAIITLSEDGMAIFDSEMTRIPTLAKEVFDVTGAGDTVIAALGFGLAGGLDIYESARFANLAAAVVVGKIGSAIATLGEVFEYGKSHNQGDFNNIDEISLLKNLQKNGKKIVFTNGCFDLLHRGHIAYLKEAKSYGDILVVGLNSDISVRNLKGAPRPINPQEDRKYILESLSFVDFVIIFNEDTPYNLIKAIMPDILVKGGDYKGQNIVGSDLAKEVKILDFVPNKSTTNIIKTIKGEKNE